MIVVKKAILAYMSTRCQVTSQHKLPCKEEFHNTVTIGWLFSQKEIDSAVDSLIAERRIIAYGPYLSDHPVDVL